MNYELSPWGAVIVTVLAVAAASVVWLIDHKLPGRLLKAGMLLLLEMALTAAYVWGLYQLDSWWADVTWLLLAAGITSLAAYAKARLHQRRLLLPLFCGLLSGSTVLGFSMLLSLKALPAQLMMVPVMAVLMSMLVGGCASALQTYEASLLHTESHRRYLLANGATPFEALTPSIRRALRAAVLPLFGSASVQMLGVMPLFLGGMLLGGVPPLPALAVSTLFLAAAFAASVLAVVVVLLCRSYWFK